MNCGWNFCRACLRRHSCGETGHDCSAPSIESPLDSTAHEVISPGGEDYRHHSTVARRLHVWNPLKMSGATAATVREVHESTARGERGRAQLTVTPHPTARCHGSTA